MDDNQLKEEQAKAEILKFHNGIRDFIKENLSIDIEEDRIEGYNDKTKRFSVKLILDKEIISETLILI